MNSNNTFETRIENQFGSFCIKVLKNEMKHIYREMRKQNKEISLEEISINECDKISSYDTYFSSESIFEVCGMEIVIYNDEIAKAIRTLSPFRRDIVLLSYFANLTDREIACHLNTVRQSVSRSRLKALRDLRKYFEMGDCK